MLRQGRLVLGGQLAKRRWRVVLLRAKDEILGMVEAPDVEAAKAAERSQPGEGRRAVLIYYYGRRREIPRSTK